MNRAWRLLLFGFVCMVSPGCDWGLLPVSEDGELDVEPGDPDGLETDVAVDAEADAPDDAPPPDGDAEDPDPTDPDGTDMDTIEPDTADPDMADPDLEEPEIPPDCGNGELDDEEECDNGTANSDTEPDACRTNCRNAHCGDGVTDSGEECDDGSANSDTVPDACRTSCRSAHCGDGVLDTGEACDYTSPFCSGCTLSAPSGWTECADSAGNPVFLYVVLTPDNVTYAEMGNYCVSLVQGMNPQDFQFYGLAVIIDDNVWECILAMIGTTQNYYIGLDQAGSGSEPGGGWRWRAHNGTAWYVVSAYNASNPYFEEYFDDAGGTGTVDCGRLAWDAGLSQWYFHDYGCDSRTNWDGICMIQF